MQQVVVAGYSLGGNLALKLAGDYGDAPPPQLRGVCAVSPVMELEACVRALERRQNFVYQWNFVRGLKARMRRKARAFPAASPSIALDAHPHRARVRRGLHRAALRLRDATDYYHRASAMRVIDRIRVPALIITAEDDPFVPTAPFRDPSVTANPQHPRHHHAARRPLRVRDRRDGATAEHDGYWAEHEIVGLRDRAHRRSEQRHQPLRELRPQPLLFVLEVDEGALRRLRVP